MYDRVVSNDTVSDQISSFNQFLAKGGSTAGWLNATDWLQPTLQVGPDVHVAHAFAVRTLAQSRLQLSIHYIVVVIAANTLKLLIMLSVLILDRSSYLVTLGDAVASFLSSPDLTTTGRCLYEDEYVLKQCRPSKTNRSVSTTDLNSTEISDRPNDRLDSLTNAGWHTRNLIYFNLVRKEQSTLHLPL